MQNLNIFVFVCAVLATLLCFALFVYISTLNFRVRKLEERFAEWDRWARNFEQFTLEYKGALQTSTTLLQNLTVAQRAATKREVMPCFVYFILNPFRSWVKIGYSYNPESRCAGLSKQYNVELEILGLVYGGRHEEGLIHKRFAAYRKEGEWFEYCDVIRDFIDANALQFDEEE